MIPEPDRTVPPATTTHVTLSAEADLTSVREQYAALEAELEAEVSRLESTWDPAAIQLETVTVKPRKSDIEVTDLALVWQPA